jgi:hypothetical protein
VLAYLTGSKIVILCIFVTTLTYYEFLVRHIPTVKVALAGAAAVAGFFALLVFQSSMTLVNLFSYFEHFDVTTRFLARFNEFGYYWGAGWLSELWFYVPRALYPDKPLEYGGTAGARTASIPARTSKGYAPGFLVWSLSYLDFGWVGVMVAGLLRGIFSRCGVRVLSEPSLQSLRVRIHDAVLSVVGSRLRDLSDHGGVEHLGRGALQTGAHVPPACGSRGDA